MRTGIEAWGDLRKLTGAYEAEKLEGIDPIVRQCIEGLGWVEWRPFFSVARGDFKKWGLVLAEHEAPDRARFCELYDRLASTAQEDAIVGQLAPPLPRRQIGAGIRALLSEPKGTPGA